MGRLFLATVVLTVGSVSAQQFVYPSKGQSAEQQEKDEYACHPWAVQHTCYDPTKPPPAPAPAPAAPPPATTASGSAPGAGLRGAARGAIVGEIVADDAGAGAAAGAVAARGASRIQNKAEAHKKQQAAAQQQNSQQQANYGKARAVCLEGRGYAVNQVTHA
ncbi:MAG: glycine zipper family protein [Burkholderiaceae bacterium]|nr:glycine zipper family protein [Burkholderiaceae bacterium]